MSTGIALIFPAFVSDYNGDEISFLARNNSHFDQYLESASIVTGIDLLSFDILHNKFLNDELKSQLLAYVFSCSVSDIIKEKNIRAGYIAGYSMGIYAGLYHTGVYSFDDGAKLIQKAYQIIVKHNGNVKFGMATIAGIDDDDLSDIIQQSQSDVEIINANSRHSFVISGKYHEIEKIVQAAILEGALLARILSVSVPYHSMHMKEAAGEFGRYIVMQKFQDSVVPIVSLIDQRLITATHDIRHELIMNISNKINWYRTMMKLACLDARVMLECGAGKSLYKMSKFMDEDIKVYPLNKMSNFIEKTKQLNISASI
ncbi:MAG: hypothetical protein V1904_00530 [Bacteroidota bacterium]